MTKSRQVFQFVVMKGGNTRREGRGRNYFETQQGSGVRGGSRGCYGEGGWKFGRGWKVWMELDGKRMGWKEVKIEMG